jgi:hypothetical protein
VRLLVVAAALVLLATGCGGGVPTNGRTTGSGQPVTTGGAELTRPTVVPSDLPKCSYPKRAVTPTWMPDDLPFPPGAYTFRGLSDEGGLHRALLVIPGSLQDVVRFVLKEWPDAGWTLGRGDAEEGEAEEQFAKSPAIGAFKAVAVYCSPGYTKMLLVFGERSAGGLSRAPGESD